MPWKIDVLDKEEVVFIKTSGTMNLAALKQLAVEGLAVSARTGAMRLLLDHRDMTPEIEAIHVYDLPRINEQREGHACSQG